MDKVSALMKKTPEISLLPLLPHEDTVRRRLTIKQDEVTHQTLYLLAL